MKYLLFILTILILVSCSNKERDLTVKVNIKGLKKGIVFLKKVKDTVLVTVDSITINGNSEFELYSDIESPEVFFLYLNKNTGNDDRILFFADKGITEIKTTLKNFVFDAKINGSKQQKTLEEYNSVLSRFNDQNLDLIKGRFEAQKEGDSSKLASIRKESDNLLKRKYLYTVNFALNNKDSEVAPYLALTEIYNAQIKYLDTINTSLTPEVKTSKYGKKLQLFIDNIKKYEKNN